MKKSKHFRKDVILARVIAAVVLILLILLIVGVVSLFAKPSGSDKDSQKTQDTQNTQHVQESQDSSLEQQDSEVVEDTQGSTEQQQSESTDPVVDSESEDENKIYIKTTTQVKLRAEANTSCATLDRIDGGTTIEVLEVLEGWFKVTHNGQVGYVSATYANVVE